MDINIKPWQLKNKRIFVIVIRNCDKLLIDLEVAEDLYKRQVTRILTTSFPKLFAIVTRIYRETKSVGLDGGIISYPANKQIQAKFPPSSIMKSICIGLQVKKIYVSVFNLKLFVPVIY